jgi:limonene 1,2-monooxygenase
MVQRDRQDEAIGVIKRLLAGERVTQESEWFTLRDARLQLFPVQEDLPFAVASQVSPSGMTLAGKYGAGVLSIGSMSTAGLLSLPTQWSFAEESAAKHGRTVDRKDWRVVMVWHLAETREEARAQAGEGLMRWHNEYNVGTLMRPGAVPYGSPDEAVNQTAFAEGAVGVVGTPDDLVAAIRRLMEISGGFGTVIGFAHDWANRENTLRSWDLVARHVIPEVNGLLEGYRTSRQYVIEHRESFERAGQAVMQKIMGNERAAAALQETIRAQTATTGGHTPDLEKEKEKAR